MTQANTKRDGQGDAGLTVEKTAGEWLVTCTGHWVVSGIAAVDPMLRKLVVDAPAIALNTSAVEDFDTAGAWLVERVRSEMESAGKAFTHNDSDERHMRLVDVVHAETALLHRPARGRAISNTFSGNPLERIGKFIVSLGRDFLDISNIIGAAVRGPQLKAGRRGGVRIHSIVNQLDHMALRAFPVIAVMSFLIGAIIAQQGAFQLKSFGEELLTVNLVGILHLREISVLLTAIMVAGRSGSAITAELGTMKMREEIDALRVIGLNPVSILIFPRILALIIAVPILTLLADFAGLAGAILVSWLYIDITPMQFIHALNSAIDLSTLFSGLIKAPFMAMIIGLVAAVEGLKVSGSAESLGQHTTSAVVRSIFAVIVLDGLFAMFYAAIDY